MATREISNTDDLIDSRDVIARFEELQGIKDAIEEAVEARDELTDDGEDCSQDELEEANDRVQDAEEEFAAIEDEYNALKSLIEEAEGSPDWSYGESLIRESYFKEYAQQLADDIGAVPNDAQWPCNCIDWDEAASLLKQDYYEVDFGGETYLIRS